MHIESSGEENGLILVKTLGRITQQDFEQNEEPLAKAFGPDVYSRCVLMNLRESDYMDSSGIGWLLACHKRFRASGGRLVIHSIPKLIENLFRILKMSSVLELVADETAARDKVKEAIPR